MVNRGNTLLKSTRDTKKPKLTALNDPNVPVVTVSYHGSVLWDYRKLFWDFLFNFWVVFRDAPQRSKFS